MRVVEYYLVGVVLICEPASHASHHASHASQGASHASHASHGFNVRKNTKKYVPSPGGLKAISKPSSPILC